MKTLLELEKTICRKNAGVFELAAQHGYTPLLFVEKWSHAPIAKELFELNPTIICQSKAYILHDVEKYIDVQPNDEAGKYIELMFWAGYVLMYAAFATGFCPEQIYKKYDTKAFMSHYDVYHTLSSKRMVEELITNYDKAENARK